MPHPITILGVDLGSAEDSDLLDEEKLILTFFNFYPNSAAFCRLSEVSQITFNFTEGTWKSEDEWGNRDDDGTIYDLLTQIKQRKIAKIRRPLAMTVIDEIAAERKRQIEVEGWTPEHDDQHTDASLASAAACYALPSPEVGPRGEYELPLSGEPEVQVVYADIPDLWPRSWQSRWWKPKDRRRDLIRAGALIVAEIERLDRQGRSQ